MGIALSPVEKIARKILLKHNITKPSNIDALALKYAEVLYRKIPIENVDGISLNLKLPGKKPVIIVNSLCKNARSKFTLAHELGHVIIPWHIGTIVDNIYQTSVHSQIQYFIQEQEANSFAAEILMPARWMEQLITEKIDLAELHNLIKNQADVSAQAAAIRILNFMPKNVFYVATENSIVVHSSRSNGSNLLLPENNIQFDKYNIQYVENYTHTTQKGIVYHWYKLNNEIEINSDNDLRTWREILDSIILEIYPPNEHAKIKQSINGILASANDTLIRSNESYDIPSLTSTCIFRINRSDFETFCRHKDFELFISKRVRDFVNKKQ